MLFTNGRISVRQMQALIILWIFSSALIGMPSASVYNIYSVIIGAAIVLAECIFICIAEKRLRSSNVIYKAVYILSGISMIVSVSYTHLSAEALETLHLVKTVIMDKTGTITEGKPVVTDILSDGISEDELLKIAASVEKPSEHPLAGAIIEAAEEKNIDLKEIKEFTAVSGRGIIAESDGKIIYAGNKKRCV